MAFARVNCRSSDVVAREDIAEQLEVEDGNLSEISNKPALYKKYSVNIHIHTDNQSDDGASVIFE